MAEHICPKCGLDREAALENLAHGDFTMEWLMGACPLCRAYLEGKVAATKALAGLGRNG